MTSARRRLLDAAVDVIGDLSKGQVNAVASEVERGDPASGISKVGGLGAPASVTALSAAWTAFPEMPASELATALRVGAASARQAHGHESVQLLYTGPNPGTIRRNLAGLLEVIRSARETLFVVSFVVAYADELIVALGERADSGVDVDVLLDEEPSAFEFACKRFADLAPRVRLWVWAAEANQQRGTVHAKCAVADGRQAFVSSANLTGKAMERNLEVGYLVTGGPTPSSLRVQLSALRDSAHLESASPEV